MSAHSNCSACMVGNHANHDGTHHGLPGVLGGWHCGCRGDCADRHAKAMERLFGPLREALQAREKVPDA